MSELRLIRIKSHHRADYRNIHSNRLGVQYPAHAFTMAPSFLTNSHAPDASPLASGTPSNIKETEFLIVGAGPAGAALACFLSSYGGLSFELLETLG